MNFFNRVATLMVTLVVLSRLVTAAFNTGEQAPEGQTSVSSASPALDFESKMAELIELSKAHHFVYRNDSSNNASLRQTAGKVPVKSDDRKMWSPALDAVNEMSKIADHLYQHYTRLERSNTTCKASASQLELQTLSTHVLELRNQSAAAAGEEYARTARLTEILNTLTNSGECSRFQELKMLRAVVMHNASRTQSNLQEVQGIASAIYNASEEEAFISSKFEQEQKEIENMTNKQHQYMKTELNMLTKQLQDVLALMTRAPEAMGWRHPQDCWDVQNKGFTSPGVYPIHPPGVDTFRVWCEDGRTTIQRRTLGDVSFNRTFAEYKTGFGSADGDYWLGLSKLHVLTNQSGYGLVIEFLLQEDNNMRIYLETDHFKIGPEADNYTMEIGSYINTMNDLINVDRIQADLDGAEFTVQESQDSCRGVHNSGWWMPTSGCSMIDLNTNQGQGSGCDSDNPVCARLGGELLSYVHMYIVKHPVKLE